MFLPSRIRCVPRIVRYVAVIVALAAMTRCASAATRFVAPCGNDAWLGLNANCAAPFGPKRTIQAAINASVNGDQVSVLPGAYVGGIDTDGKAIRILGLAGAATTILDGNGTQRVLTINSLEGAGTILEGLTITNGDTASGGGGALISLASPSFIGCVFSFSHADGDGGAVWCSLASPTFTGCTFHDNSAGAYGGGIHAINGGVSLIGCLVDDNLATNGGGICFNGGNHDRDDGDISNNTATFGAGMNVRGNANVEIVDSDLSTNDAGHLGGGLAKLSGSSIDADNVMIATNSASIRGGGANVLSSVMNFNACPFWANQASGEDGGAIGGLDGAAMNLVRCTIEGTSASGAGGGVYFFGDELRVASTRLIDNAAPQGAGAAIGLNATASIFNSVFAQNTALNFGGGLAVSGSAAADVINCTFSSNASSFNGGAIYSSGSELRLRNSIV